MSANFSFTGNFASANDVQYFSFKVAADTTVVLRTWSYGGGINANGSTIPNGGFDPILGLFQSWGSVILKNDNGWSNVTTDPVTGGQYDSYISSNVVKGTYIVALTAASNWPPGHITYPYPNTGNFNGRSTSWAFDISNVEAAGTGQEPPPPAALPIQGLLAGPATCEAAEFGRDRIVALDPRQANSYANLWGPSPTNPFLDEKALVDQAPKSFVGPRSYRATIIYPSPAYNYDSTNYKPGPWYCCQGSQCSTGLGKDVSHLQIDNGLYLFRLEKTYAWANPACTSLHPFVGYYGTNNGNYSGNCRNSQPVAVITGPSSAGTNETITLSGANSSDYDGDTLSYSWNFGCGNNATTCSLVNPSISYSTAGTKTVTLTVTDNVHSDFQKSHTVSKTITVSRPVGIPTATLSISPTTVYANIPVHLTASVQDPYNDPLTIVWDYGDNTALDTQTGIQPNGVTDVSKDYRFKKSGVYDVKLTVKNSVHSRSATATVTVDPSPIDIHGPYLAQVNVDPNIVATVSNQLTQPFSYEWDYGNGDTSTGLVTSYVYPLPGQFTITLNAKDSAGLVVATDSTTISVSLTDILAELGDSPESNREFCAASPLVGHPINAATGNKYLQVTDYSRADMKYLPIEFKRYYNSMGGGRDIGIGANWTHSYSGHVEISTSAVSAIVHRPGGGGIRFTKVNNLWESPFGVTSQLIETANYWEYRLNNGVSEFYKKSDGLLMNIVNRTYGFVLNISSEYRENTDGNRYIYIGNVADNYGRGISMNWLAEQGILSSIHASGWQQNQSGIIAQFYYYLDLTTGSGISRLKGVHLKEDTGSASVIRSATEYFYDSSLPYAITKIRNLGPGEAHYRYDKTTGKAISSRLGSFDLGIEKYEFKYLANGTTIVTNPLGITTTYSFDTTSAPKTSNIDGLPCGSCGIDFSGVTYDPTSGLVDIVTDAAGIQTDYDHNERGLITNYIEAKATVDQRVKTTTWDSEHDVPTCLIKPTSTTIFTYTKTPNIITLNNLASFTHNIVTAVDKTTVDTSDTTALFPTAVSRQCDAILARADYASLKHSTTSYVYGPTGITLVDGPRIDVDDSISINERWLTPANATEAHHLVTITPNGSPSEAVELDFGPTTLDHDGLPNTRIQGELVTETANANTGAPLYIKKYDKAQFVAGGSPSSFIEYVYYQYSPLLKTISQKGAGDFRSYYYDSAGRIDIIVGKGGVKTITLNKLSQPTNTVITASSIPNTPAERTEQAIYDPSTGRLKSSSSLGTNTEYVSYYMNGNIEDFVTGSLYTNTTYDNLGRVKTVTQSDDPRNGRRVYFNDTTNYTYNSNNQISGVQDPRLVTTTMDYDGLGNLLSIDSPDSNYRDLDYDEAGNRVFEADTQGNGSTSTYDSQNRIKTTTFTDGSIITYSYNVTTAVTASGRICADVPGKLQKLVLTYTDLSESVTEYCYNSIGKLIAKIDTADGTVMDEEYYYDDVKGVVSNIHTAASSGVDSITTYRTDWIRRIAEIDIDSLPFMSGIEYVPVGPVKQWSTHTLGVPDRRQPGDVLFGTIRSYSNSSTAGFTGTGLLYSIELDKSLDRIELVLNPIALAPPSSMVFERDSSNFISQIKTDGYLFGGPNVKDIYINKQGMVQDVRADSKMHSYMYDASGNLRAEYVIPIPPAGGGDYIERSVGYTRPNRSNKLTNLTTNTQTSSTAARVTTSTNILNDYAGRITNDGSLDYEYNVRGQLISVTNVSKNEKTTYQYNALGERIKKTLETLRNRSVTRYFYNPGGQLKYEVKGAGNSKVTQVYYYLGEMLVAVKQFYINPRFGSPQEALYIVHTNQVDAPILVTNATNGDIRWQADYDVWGEAAVTTNYGLRLNIRAPGQYYDQESGLHYNLHRYYSPKLRRYMTPDPIGLEGGINPYMYANNNTLRYTDPLGLDPHIDNRDNKPIRHKHAFPTNTRINCVGGFDPGCEAISGPDHYELPHCTYCTDEYLPCALETSPDIVSCALCTVTLGACASCAKGVADNINCGFKHCSSGRVGQDEVCRPDSTFEKFSTTTTVSDKSLTYIPEGCE